MPDIPDDRPPQHATSTPVTASSAAVSVEPAITFPPLAGKATLGTIIEALLKQPGSLLVELNGDRRTPVILKLGLILALSMLVYGVVVGSLSGGTQLWAAPLKVSLGMIFSILICLPSLYIFLCLNGADLRIGQVSGALLGTGCIISLLLIGFAPVAWIFSQSTNSILLMGWLHLIFWTIGVWFGLRLLNGLLRYGGGEDKGHLKVWIVIFVLVSLQMTAVVRPLIGTAETFLPTDKKFFVAHWLDVLHRQ